MREISLRGKERGKKKERPWLVDTRLCGHIGLENYNDIGALECIRLKKKKKKIIVVRFSRKR